MSGACRTAIPSLQRATFLAKVKVVLVHRRMHVVARVVIVDVKIAWAKSGGRGLRGAPKHQVTIAGPSYL